ncbi:MAG: uracil-DNA glycosylase family protein [Solirubrobacteraceae bacterium]
MSTSRRQQLHELYDEIHEWASGDDPELVPRRVIDRSLDAEVMLVGQALARDTQRLSGLPYTFPNGEPSGGGRELARFLGRFDHSIDPDTKARYAHSTDLVPRFPGRKPSGSGDKKPTTNEIAHCAPWLDRETEIIAPRVVVLLGALPTRFFLERHAGQHAAKLREVAGTEIPVSIEATRAAAFPVYHPSGAWQFPRQAPAAFERAAQAIRTTLTS